MVRCDYRLLIKGNAGGEAVGTPPFNGAALPGLAGEFLLVIMP